MASASASENPASPKPKYSRANKGERPSVLMGDIDLVGFYHKGAVIANESGINLLVVEGWADLPGEEPPYGAKVQLCDPSGAPLPESKVRSLSHVPKTALSIATEEKASSWTKRVTLVSSCNPKLPAGIASDDLSLLLVPYGQFFGQEVGLLNSDERKAMAETARNAAFKTAILEAKQLPGAHPPQKNRVRLSEESMARLLKEQGEVIRGIPLVNVIEEYCGYAPDEVKGPTRKYRVGDQIINLNTAKNSFGSLNDFKFQSLSKARGSSNNAIDMVAAVREMEGGSADFRTIRQGLIQGFNLQSKLDLMFEDALRQEAARLSGQKVTPTNFAASDVSTNLKAPLEKKPVEEEEVPFDLQTGMPVGSTEPDRGGGFCMRPDLWPAARKFLVDERKLDPMLVDHLYEAKNLYAARRQFPVNPKFPYKSNYQDVIVAPVFGFKTGEVVGVDTKPLPRKPGEKTEGRNHGKTGQGAFMFGAWDKDTKRVVLTEGFIKGIAWLQLHRETMQVGQETCVMSRSGAKPTLEIIPRLKEIGAEAIVAYDNDFTGRQKSKAFYDECTKQGVPCREMFVEPSEVTALISNEAVEGLNGPEQAKKRTEEIIAFAEKNGLPWAHDKQRETATITAIRLPNTNAVIDHIEEHLRVDRALANKLYQVQAKGLSEFEQSKLEKRRWMRLEIHHKDWDDIVKKGPFQPLLGTEAKTAVAPGVSQVSKQPDISAAPASTLAPETAAAAPAPQPKESPKIAEIAAPPSPSHDPAPEQKPAETTASSPTPATASPRVGLGSAHDWERGLLVSRLVKTGDSENHVFSVGTADAIFDLQLKPQAVDALRKITSPGTPNPAIITGGSERTLVAIGTNDAEPKPVDLSQLGEFPVNMTPSPEGVLRGWLNPTKPSIVEAVNRLRRAVGLPTPVQSPTLNQSTSDAQKPTQM